MKIEVKIERTHFALRYISDRLHEIEQELDQLRIDADQYHLGAHIVMARSAVEAARDNVEKEMKHGV